MAKTLDSNGVKDFFNDLINLDVEIDQSLEEKSRPTLTIHFKDDLTVC